jgi:signal peptidase I
MSLFRQIRRTIVVSVAICVVVTKAQPSWSDAASPNLPIYSEAFCLKIFEETVERARSSTWQISDRDRHILTQCRTKFPTAVDPTIPIPKAAQCLDVVKTLVRDGTKKLKELELPEEQVRSLSRCDEVLTYYNMPSDGMLPTLKPQDRIVIDKTSYQTQAPQRGDIVAVKGAKAIGTANASQPLTNRIIGLPGETVKIIDGKVYINDRPLREDYVTKTSKVGSLAVAVPANGYFALGDNRNYAENLDTTTVVTREAIVGKVIWHFGSK